MMELTIGVDLRFGCRDDIQKLCDLWGLNMSLINPTTICDICESVIGPNEQNQSKRKCYLCDTLFDQCPINYGCHKDDNHNVIKSEDVQFSLVRNYSDIEPRFIS